MDHNATTPTLGEILMVKASELVVANEFGVNRMNATELQPLVSSIVRFGLLHPPGVYLENSRFHLAYGHRRYAAAVLCGIDVIPCLLINKEDALSAFIAENIQRKNLNFFDLTCVRKKDMECRGMSWDEYAEKILEIPKTTFFEHLSIFKLPDEIFERHRRDRMLGLRALKRVMAAGSLADMHGVYTHEMSVIAKPKPRKPRKRCTAGVDSNSPQTPPKNLPAQNKPIVPVQYTSLEQPSNAGERKKILEEAVFVPVAAKVNSSVMNRSGSTNGMEHSSVREMIAKATELLNLGTGNNPARLQMLGAMMVLAVNGCGNAEVVQLLRNTQNDPIQSSKAYRYNFFRGKTSYGVLNILLRFRACLARLIKSAKGGICKLFSSVC
jgi:ParB/RepB/Spo0J family partition protein